MRMRNYKPALLLPPRFTTAAASSATSAASTLTTLQQKYPGAASSDPPSNLTEGDLYFKTGSGGGMRVYNGSAWVNAAFDVSGALINTNNLSDVSSAATALTNLGVTSTAAELNLLDAITRGSILYGNASGATARLAKGAAGTVLTSDGTDISWAAPAASGVTYVTKTANYTTQDLEGVLANTSGGAFTVTLPASPSAGAQVIVADSGDAFGTNNLTVARNGETIDGTAANLVLDITGVSVQFVYNGSTWNIIFNTP